MIMMVEKYCLTCGKLLEKTPNVSKQYFREKKNYCSNRCVSEKLRKQLSGKPRSFEVRLKIAKSNRKYPEKEGWIEHGYMQYQELLGPKKYKHREVWKEHYGEIPKGAVVHHIDGNKLNNEITNLMLLPSLSDHVKLHYQQGDIKIGEYV